MRTSVYALAASAATALAQVKGFNYASNGQTQQSFIDQFNVAKNLVGTSGWTSARLYTMIQDATVNTAISAIPAAIATNTTLLLGLWASEDQAAFNNELAALSNAINQYGSSFADLVVGISVGSEDLYRVSELGQAVNAGYGVGPNVVTSYISQVRSAISNTVLGSKPVGHVDTWNSFTNSSNAAVVAASDFLGMDAYPYFQTGYENSIENAGNLFFSAYDQVAALGKPVWVTETGWPVSGADMNLAHADVASAESFWQQVSCKLQGTVNTWWYILVDAGANPSFGVTGSLSTTPLYDLSCAGSSSSSSAAASSTASSVASSSSVAAATTPSTAATSTTVAFSNPVPSASYASSSVVSSSASTPAASTSAASIPAASTATVVVVGSGASTVASGTSAAVASSAVASSTVASSAVASSAVASSAVSSAAVASSAVSSAASSAISSTAAITTSTTHVAGGETITIYSTTLLTITACNASFVTACPTSMSTVVTAPVPGTAVISTASVSSGAAAASSSASASLATVATSVTSAAASTVVPSGSASASGCPADLNGAYQYPHLIVPINASSPNTAYGTQYNGTITPKVSTIFNFDIPASYAGKQCSTVFLFPKLNQLETSSYSFNNQGGFTISILNGVATESTTYANAPAVLAQIGSVPELKSGSSYTLSHDSCPGGARVSFQVTSTGGLDLEFFQDYNPSPLGLYVRAC